MMRYEDEQLESMVRAETPIPNDLPGDARVEVKAMGAIRSRLSGAFNDVHAPAALTDRIRSAARSAVAVAEPPSPFISPPVTAPSAPVSAPASTPIPLHRPAARFPVWARLGVAAAAVLLLSVGGPMLFLSPETASAQPILTDIHRANLAQSDGFHAMQDPTAVCARLCEETGITPAIPAGAVMLGCSARRFGKGEKPTYLVRIPEGEVSIIVIDEAPESLQLNGRIARGATTYHACKHDGCRIVSGRINNLTYIAVSEAPHEAMIDLLERIRDGQ